MKRFSCLEGDMNLSKLKVGDKAKVVALNVSDKEVRRHLLDMGVTRGVVVKIIRKAPMGDPVDIELRDYELCISKKELEQIEVEVIK
jgi:Fe2+ transport system protein FeoA